MDIELVAKWVGAIALILSVANTIWAVLMRDVRDSITRLASVKTKVIDHDKRLQSVEHEMRHLPSKDEVMEIKLSIESIRGTMSRLESGVGSVTRAVQRIDDYLREKR